jgi:hypothetical protein
MPKYRDKNSNQFRRESMLSRGATAICLLLFVPDLPGVMREPDFTYVIDLDAMGIHLSYIATNNRINYTRNVFEYLEECNMIASLNNAPRTLGRHFIIVQLKPVIDLGGEYRLNPEVGVLQTIHNMRRLVEEKRSSNAREAVKARFQKIAFKAATVFTGPGDYMQQHLPGFHTNSFGGAPVMLHKYRELGPERFFEQCDGAKEQAQRKADAKEKKRKRINAYRRAWNREAKLLGIPRSDRKPGRFTWREKARQRERAKNLAALLELTDDDGFGVQSDEGTVTSES